MTNVQLLQSAFIFGSIHGITFYFFPVPWIFMIYNGCGIVTSLLNHGFTNTIFKWADRFMMGVGLIMDIWFQWTICDVPTVFFLITGELASVVGYGLAKKNGSTHYHIMAHGMLTMVHVGMTLFVFEGKTGSQVFHEWEYE